jgi:hypothetical protein
MDTNPTKQRQQFYRDYASGQWSMSELCDRYQISRPTGYKWVAADQQQLGSIDLGCSLAAYCFGRDGTGQRCCWPLNADPLGRAEPLLTPVHSPVDRRFQISEFPISLVFSVT